MTVRGHEHPSSEDPAGTGDAENRPRFIWRNVGVFVGLLLLNYLIVSTPPASSEAAPALVGAT